MATCKLTLHLTSASSSAISNGMVTGNCKVRRYVKASSITKSEIFAGNRLSARVPSYAAAGICFTRSTGFVTECKIKKGDALPSVSLKDQDGKVVNLTRFKGKPLVVYFYPADDSPGCTKQACAFRDSYEKFKKAGAEVVGVSGDTPESHRAFRQKYRLPYTLLSDQDNKIRKDWGIPGDFFGSLPGRQTYVFDKNGVVQLIFNNQFEPEKHIGETLKIVQS